MEKKPPSKFPAVFFYIFFLLHVFSFPFWLLSLSFSLDFAHKLTSVFHSNSVKFTGVPVS